MVAVKTAILVYFLVGIVGTMVFFNYIERSCSKNGLNSPSDMLIFTILVMIYMPILMIKALFLTKKDKKNHDSEDKN